MKNLSRFFLITFIWSWLWWGLLLLAGSGLIPLSPDGQKKLTLPLCILGAFGPLVGALFSLRPEFGKGAILKYLRTFLDVRIGWKAAVLPALILGGTTAIAWLLPETFGRASLPMLLPSIWVFIPYLLTMMLLGGGQEEFGWRGYALPRLEERMGLWKANLVLGLVWALWHLPLWFIPGSSQTFMNFGGFILLTTGYSFLFSWFRSLAGNRPFSGLYAHGLANAFIPFMPVLEMQKDAAQPRFWIWVTLTFVIGFVAMVYRTKWEGCPGLACRKADYRLI
jgi:uncharacterized protein